MSTSSPTTGEPGGIRTTTVMRKANMATLYLTLEPILENTSDELDSTFAKKQSTSTPIGYISIKIITKTLWKSKSQRRSPRLSGEIALV